MSSKTAALRSRVASALAARVVSPFEYCDRPLAETVPAGIHSVDFLTGGFPRGSLTEIYGPPCSGRTSLLISALASRTAASEVCALVDARDAFDPASAEAAGVKLKHLLWVRCRNVDQALRATDLLIQGGGFGLIALDFGDTPAQTVRYVPLQVWFRFRRAVESTPTILVVVEQESNAKTCASLVLQLHRNPPLCSVAAINEKAALAGIEIGMTKMNAAQFAGLEMRPRSRSQEKIAHAVLLDIGWSVSPRIEDTSQDTIVLDLFGLTHLFGAEENIGALLARRSCECGLLSNVAIASNVDTALIAARGFQGVTVIPLGQESKCLGGLPVSVFSPSAELAETLGRWGVRTCAAFAGLSVLQLSERLGQEGVRLHALARSLAAASIRVRFELQPAFENALDLRKEMFRQTNPPGGYERELQLPVPAHDSKMLLKLLRLRLQSNPPAAPIRKIVLAAEPVRPRAMQGGLFLPSFPDPEKLEVTIARIANVVGEGNVGSPSLVDTYRPGEFQMRRFLAPLGAAETARNDSGVLRPNRPRDNLKAPASFRIFRPPVPATLDLHNGRPARVFVQGLRGEVLAASGPWRTSGDWWRDDPWHQDEWDLEIHFQSSPAGRDTPMASPPDGDLYRFYYDALRGSWFVRGIYD